MLVRIMNMFSQKYYRHLVTTTEEYWKRRIERRRRRSRFIRESFEDLKQILAMLAHLRYGIDMGNSEKQKAANQHHDPETPQTK